MSRHSLSSLFEPTSVAVVGASTVMGELAQHNDGTFPALLGERVGGALEQLAGRDVSEVVCREAREQGALHRLEPLTA